jgi:hypothetical protein
MGDNDDGYSHKNATDKGIKHVNVGAGTEPTRILGTPMLREPTIPNGFLRGPAITSAQSADLSKLSPSIAAGVRQVVARK